MSKRWLLIVFNVPDRLGGLCGRFGFKPTRKNPRNWWRAFDPAIDKDLAVRVRGEFVAAGLKGAWKEVDVHHRVAYAFSRSHHMIDFSRRNSEPGNWRLKARRRK